MKFLKTLTCALLLACAVTPATATAQGLGGLLKKAKDVVDKGSKVADALLGDETKGKGKSVFTTENGITVVNPMIAYLDVVPVGLYGVTTNENVGNAYLVLQLTNKTDKQDALIGSSINNQKMVAADNKGKVYNIDASGARRYDTPRDMMVQVVMDEPDMQFLEVNRNLEVMPVVKVGINLDAQHQGNLTFKNVPIYWDEVPE